MAVATRSCVIATTPRSGSWLLAEALHATGRAGEPQEYFGWEGFAAWTKEFGLEPDAGHLAFVEAAIAHGTTDNGVFATKLHWTQLGRFLRRLRRSPGSWPSDPAEVLACCFPDVRYVRLRREDTARQAISYFRANTAKRWWDLGGDPHGGDDLEPDFQQIRWCEATLTDQDRRWRALVRRSGRPVVELTYEALVEDRQAAVEQVLELLEVADGAVDLPPPTLRRQSDATTEEWLVAYRAVRDELDDLPERWHWEQARIVPDAEQPHRSPSPPRRPLPGGRRGGGRASGPFGPAPELPWSLRYVVDEAGAETGLLAVRGPLGEREQELVRELTARRRLVGWSSYGTFPRSHERFDGDEAALTGQHGRERSYVAACEAWVHCFRAPERFLPAGVPWLLLSESDFVEPREVRAAAGRVEVDGHDVAYVCCPNDFNETTKNWRLARRCLARLADDLGTTALLVGRLGAADLPEVPGLSVVDELPRDELLARLARCRVLLVPNVLDASPQLIVEALALDVPVVVNEQILGGWKYVHDATGRFFTNEDDVTEAVRACLASPLSPREWIGRHGGAKRAERRLARFLDELDAPPARGPIGRARLAAKPA